MTDAELIKNKLDELEREIADHLKLPIAVVHYVRSNHGHGRSKEHIEAWLVRGIDKREHVVKTLMEKNKGHIVMQNIRTMHLEQTLSALNLRKEILSVLQHISEANYTYLTQDDNIDKHPERV